MTDITVKDANKSPIHRAAYFGEIEDLKRCFVEEGYPHYNIKDEAGLTPLYLAAQMGYLDICEEILSKTKDASCKSHEDGTTPLHQAALHGHIQICQLLIDKMNDVDSRDFGGDTPLSYAALYGHGKLCEILMAKAKDINPSDNEGITVIHRAAYNKLWRICNTILDRIEDKNPKDLVNNTLLHLAAKFGNLQLVKRVMIESENDDDRMMESWEDLCSLVNKDGKYRLPNPYFREMRCLLVKLDGLDLFLKCMKTFHQNSDLVESMVICMGHVVRDEDSRKEMMRQDFVQQVLTLVDSEHNHICWLALNLLATMLNDGAEMWQKTKTNLEDMLAKIDEIYAVWDVSSVLLGFSRSTFQEMLMLVQSDVPQLQHHALWSLAYFTRQENNIDHTHQCKLLVDEGGVQILNDLSNLSEKNLQMKSKILENINAWENLRNA